MKETTLGGTLVNKDYKFTLCPPKGCFVVMIDDCVMSVLKGHNVTY